MKNNLRIILLLDIATYVSIVTMSLLGISGFASLNLQLIALGLCLLFGILYHYFFRTGRYRQNPNLYFGAQTIILALVLSLGSRSTDAFNFLFLLLAIHAARVLPGKQALIWISIFYSIISSILLITSGANSGYAVLFYLVAYFVCGFFGYILQQAELARDQNKKLLDELQATQQKLQEFAVMEERNRLARDLHDSVKQQVFAISMQLSAARTALSETDQAYQSVTEAERLAQQAGAELTTLINALRPPGLEKKTLANAIREHVDEWSRQTNIEGKTTVDSTIHPNQQVEQALFRVLQEALSNVARHSKAQKVKVDLKLSENMVVLTVEDNGIGFDAKQIRKGIGLDSMHERLAAVNGVVDVVSTLSKGTRVTAKVRMS